MKLLSFVFSIFHSLPRRNKFVPHQSSLRDESFHGLWKIHDNSSTNHLIHLSKQGRVIAPPNDTLIGMWFRENNNYFGMIFFKNKDFINKMYYGRENDLNINGNVTYGLDASDYLGNFSMQPVFPSLHNRSYHHEPYNKTLVDFNHVTGKWLFTNTHTNTIFIINIYDNFTWSSNVHMNYVYLGGIWNMYNSDDDIDLTTSVRTSGDYIWLLAQKISKHQNRFYLNSDILYIGKITNLAKQYYYSEEMPSDTTTKKQIIASKINGTIIYGCELEPERSETFFMTRWWEHH